jgi:UDP-glucuronate 4-epimerase
MTMLVTGAAGFIGAALCERLLLRGDEIIGVDNLNDYYDVSLKKARLARLEDYSGFKFEQLDISGRESLIRLFTSASISSVVNLAAQAGVRNSILNPDSYVDSNLVGFGNVLEACRQFGVENLVFASSSSVYGANTRLPFSESDNVDHPLSLYAATKKANELMAHSYSHLFRLPVTGLRFFTVYGPWGRPDMALFRFTKRILEGRPIDVYNHGRMQRDFTYIDDIIDGVVRAVDNPAEPDSAWSGLKPEAATSLAPYRLFNIGAHTVVDLMEYIRLLERQLNRKAEINFMGMQDGDVPATFADVSRISDGLGYQPTIGVEVGVSRFVEWYKDYYKVPNAGVEP